MGTAKGGLRWIVWTIGFGTAEIFNSDLIRAYYLGG